MGVSHADDIQYLFYSPDYSLETPEEFAVKEFMVSAWTNFAVYGDPAPPGSKFSWEPSGQANVFMNISGANPQVMQFNENIENRMKFWENITTYH